MIFSSDLLGIVIGLLFIGVGVFFVRASSVETNERKSAWFAVLLGGISIAFSILSMLTPTQAQTIDVASVTRSGTTRSVGYSIQTPKGEKYSAHYRVARDLTGGQRYQCVVRDTKAFQQELMSCEPTD